MSSFFKRMGDFVHTFANLDRLNEGSVDQEPQETCQEQQEQETSSGSSAVGTVGSVIGSFLQPPASPQDQNQAHSGHTSHSEVHKKSKKKGSSQKQPSDLTYVIKNVIGMGFPSTQSTRIKAHPGMDSSIVADYLKHTHGDDHFMVWNLSEESYDYSMFCNQVIEYSFKGHPAPPLGLLFKLVTSIESWLVADEANNVAVVHCMTGKGRTCVVLAALLTWMQRFANPMRALEYVCTKRQLDPDTAINPSQKRYLQYFMYMYEGVKPRSEPMVLRRVIMNGIPTFEDVPQSTRVPMTQDEEDEEYQAEGTGSTKAGCRPLLQIFRNGQLLFSSAWKLKEEQQEEFGTSKLVWCSEEEGSMRFPVDLPLKGDALIRCRHITESNKRVSMFRAALHIGYIPRQVLRLSKMDVDMACNDNRFPDDFFLELVFEPVQSSNASTRGTNTVTPKTEGSDSGALEVRGQDTGPYDAMLQADSSFWEEVSKKKEKRGQDASLVVFGDNEESTSLPSVSSANQVAVTAAADAPHKQVATFGIAGDSDEEDETQSAPESGNAHAENQTSSQIASHSSAVQRSSAMTEASQTMSAQQEGHGDTLDQGASNKDQSHDQDAPNTEEVLDVDDINDADLLGNNDAGENDEAEDEEQLEELEQYLASLDTGSENTGK
eukprot:gb/GECG01005706.1/.p1 GENE.gb/GECG01005706.1/~~gb/GECG01005706.1/.p1  ORF type:complete len:661 (+),score=112.01 gb/GECG01005706.1/:1-1983(+)